MRRHRATASIWPEVIPHGTGKAVLVGTVNSWAQDGQRFAYVAYPVGGRDRTSQVGRMVMRSRDQPPHNRAGWGPVTGSMSTSLTNCRPMTPKANATLSATLPNEVTCSTANVHGNASTSRL